MGGPGLLAGNGQVHRTCTGMRAGSAQQVAAALQAEPFASFSLALQACCVVTAPCGNACLFRVCCFRSACFAFVASGVPVFLCVLQEEEDQEDTESLADGYASVASGLASSLPSGIETPAEIDLRKTSEGGCCCAWLWRARNFSAMMQAR